MALLHMDGFDSYATAADLAMEYQLSSGNILTTGGRFSTGAYQANDADTKRIQKLLASTVTEMWTGAAVQTAAGGGQPGAIFNFSSSFGTEVLLTYDPSTNIWAIWRGDKITSLGTYSSMLNATAWHWVEMRCLLHPTTGTTELWIDGVQVINLTGQNTRQNGSATGFDRAILGDVSTRHTTRNFDDWYVLDLSGSVNNSRLGDSRIVTLVPTSDATPNNGTPSTGTSHFALVDEPQNNTTDFLDLTNTSGQEELFGMSDLSPTLTQVYAVKCVAQGLKTDVDALSLAAVIKSGATEVAGTGVAQTLSTYVHTNFIRETDPNTSTAWTNTTVNAMLCGVKVP